jgi:hypothetical protein
VAASGVTTLGRAPPLAGRTASADTQQLGRLRVTRLDLAAPVLPLASLAERSGSPTRWRTIQGVARRCLELPPRPGAPARLTVPGLTLGNALAGHVALLPPATAGPGRLLVQVDDGPPMPVMITPGAGWQPFRFDTMSLAHTSRSVTVEAEVPAGGALCLEALVLP